MIIDEKHSKFVQKLDKDFWREYKSILQKAIEISEDRHTSYVGNGSILEYWIGGQNDLRYEINKKNKRLIGLLALEEKEGKDKTGKTTDNIEDTLIDLINYAAYFLSYRNALMCGANKNLSTELYDEELKITPSNKEAIFYKR